MCERGGEREVNEEMRKSGWLVGWLIDDERDREREREREKVQERKVVRGWVRSVKVDWVGWLVGVERTRAHVLQSIVIELQWCNQG
jgi:hypothetical protein